MTGMDLFDSLYFLVVWLDLDWTERITRDRTEHLEALETRSSSVPHIRTTSSTQRGTQKSALMLMPHAQDRAWLDSNRLLSLMTVKTKLHRFILQTAALHFTAAPPAARSYRARFRNVSAQLHGGGILSFSFLLLWHASINFFLFSFFFFFTATFGPCGVYKIIRGCENAPALWVAGTEEVFFFFWLRVVDRRVKRLRHNDSGWFPQSGLDHRKPVSRRVNITLYFT